MADPRRENWIRAAGKFRGGEHLNTEDRLNLSVLRGGISKLSGRSLCPYVLCHHAGRNNDLSRPFLLSIGARIARLLNRGYGGHVSNTMFRKLVL